MWRLHTFGIIISEAKSAQLSCIMVCGRIEGYCKCSNVSVLTCSSILMYPYMPLQLYMFSTLSPPSFLERELQKADCTNYQLHSDVHGQFSLGLQQGTALVSSVDVIFMALMYTGSLLLGPQCTVHHTVGKELILELCTYETLILNQY